MLAAILALVLAVDPASPAAESSRPLGDSQSLRTIVPHAAGFDVYWSRYNELRLPVVSRLLRTALDLDGRVAVPTALIASPAVGQLSSGPVLPLIYWRTEEGSLYAAPLSAGGPPSGTGKLVATRADYPTIHCEPGACFARWTTLQNGARGAFLDPSGNIVSGPFPLPGTHYDGLPIVLDAEGAALVASLTDRFSVVRIARDGTVRTNVPFLDHGLYTTSAASHDGERAIVAYVPKAWPATPPSLAVSALAVSADGQTEDLGTLYAPEGAVYLTGLAIAWNGTRHLLAGGYVDASYQPRLFAVELDRQLQVVAATSIPAVFPHGARFEVVPNGDRFAIGWTYLQPTVTVYHGGSLSAPVTLEDVPQAPGPRRRLVRQ